MDFWAANSTAGEVLTDVFRHVELSHTLLSARQKLGNAVLPVERPRSPAYLCELDSRLNSAPSTQRSLCSTQQESVPTPTPPTPATPIAVRQHAAETQSTMSDVDGGHSACRYRRKKSIRRNYPYKSMSSFYWSWSYQKHYNIYLIYRGRRPGLDLGQTGLAGSLFRRCPCLEVTNRDEQSEVTKKNGRVQSYRTVEEVRYDGGVGQVPGT